MKNTNLTEESLGKREMYAKTALLFFYPFQCLNDLKLKGSYWEKFFQELHCHLESKYTKFWEKGFETLQNINDRLSLKKDTKHAKDPFF